MAVLPSSYVEAEGRPDNARLDRTLAEQLAELNLGFDLGSLDYVAFSHMHYDHVWRRQRDRRGDVARPTAGARCNVRGPGLHAGGAGRSSTQTSVTPTRASQCHSSLKFGSAPVVDYADFFSFFSSALSAPRSNGSCA